MVSVSELESKEFGIKERADQSPRLNLTKAKKTSQGNENCLYSQLTAANYKEKFDLLVKAEKEFHEGILHMK